MIRKNDEIYIFNEYEISIVIITGFGQYYLYTFVVLALFCSDLFCFVRVFSISFSIFVLFMNNSCCNVATVIN